MSELHLSAPLPFSDFTCSLVPLVLCLFFFLSMPQPILSSLGPLFISQTAWASISATVLPVLLAALAHVFSLHFAEPA